ncbi:outer membrane lipoprotein-sorting protein [Maridesulfovibrio sp.]|uniref:outer membrane lipoprotein-sorting protein n=1 Tax=Maridesulfovibrio sp. TaxID=2795000 RepID=UPI0039EFD271
MKKKDKLKLYLILIIAAAISFPQTSFAVDLQTLIRNVEEQYNGDSSFVSATMQIKTGKWERTIAIQGWSLGRSYSLTKIIKPKKEKGIATLKANKEIWNYLPRIDRVIKIPPSMMGAPWMGSHISNDDLVKANHVDLDYDLNLIEETPELWRIRCIPRPNAPVIWGKIIYTILKKDYVPKTIEYFDEEMLKVRTISFDNVQVMDGHILPLRMTVQPEDKPDERTVLTYTNLDFDISIKEDFFSLSKLKGMRTFKGLLERSRN